MPFQAILFDCDGVLVDSEPITMRVLRDCLAESGWDMPLAECMARFVGVTVRSRTEQIEARTGQPLIVPEHAGVANALGAVVGQVRMRASGTVTSPAEGRFRVHLETGPLDFGSEAEALATLEETLTAEALAAARKAGAEDPKVSVARDIRRSEIEGREVFVEAMLTATASGRPRIADG